jgi:hypothetical protein
MSVWISAWAALVAATIPLVGAVYTFTANRRAQYDRVLALASESGTAPISVDRHVIGTAFEPLNEEQRLPLALCHGRFLMPLVPIQARLVSSL